MSIDLDDKLGKVNVAVGNLMTNDCVQVSVKSSIYGLLNGVLKSNDFINSLKADAVKVNEDGKIDLNDMPVMCNIVTHSLSFVRTFAQTENIAQNLDQSSTKYIIYGIMYFVFLEVNATAVELTSFTLLFDTLWQLISFNPKDLILSMKGSCSCCKK